MSGTRTAKIFLPVSAIALLACHLRLASIHQTLPLSLLGGQVGRGMWLPWRGELSRVWQPCSPRTAACTTNLKLMLSRSACTHANIQQQHTFLHLMHRTLSVPGGTTHQSGDCLPASLASAGCLPIRNFDFVAGCISWGMCLW